jgi:hypothetical protein
MVSGFDKKNRAVYFIICLRSNGRRAMPYAVRGRTGHRRPLKTSEAGVFLCIEKPYLTIIRSFCKGIRDRLQSRWGAWPASFNLFGARACPSIMTDGDGAKTRRCVDLTHRISSQRTSKGSNMACRHAIPRVDGLRGVPSYSRQRPCTVAQVKSTASVSIPSIQRSLGVLGHIMAIRIRFAPERTALGDFHWRPSWFYVMRARQWH